MYGGNSYSISVHHLKEAEFVVVNAIGRKIKTNSTIMNQFLINIIKTLKEEKLPKVHLNPLSVKFKYTLRGQEKLGFLNLEKLRPNYIKRCNQVLGSLLKAVITNDRQK